MLQCIRFDQLGERLGMGEAELLFLI